MAHGINSFTITTRHIRMRSELTVLRAIIITRSGGNSWILHTKVSAVSKHACVSTHSSSCPCTLVISASIPPCMYSFCSNCPLLVGWWNKAYYDCLFVTYVFVKHKTNDKNDCIIPEDGDDHVCSSIVFANAQGDKAKYDWLRMLITFLPIPLVK